jgi:hypothetical protein
LKLADLAPYGTVISNKKSIQSLKENENSADVTVFGQPSLMTWLIAVVRRKDKHRVMLLFSVHSTEVEDVKRREADGRVTQISCSRIARIYTVNMEGVDSLYA